MILRDPAAAVVQILPRSSVPISAPLPTGGQARMRFAIPGVVG